MPIERAVILSCGDELTTGRIADTNAAFIADALGAIGISVAAVIIVGDDSEQMVWGWRTAMERARLVIGTGGLGPTVDDLTTGIIARVLERRLVHDEAVAAHIRRLFAALGRAMPGNNLKQALFPTGAEIIPNPLGTAPGYRIAAGEQQTWIIVLPGVPREMRAMWAASVLPWLRRVRGSDRVYVSRTLQTFGLSESGLDERLHGAVDQREARLSFRASFPEISVRFTVGGQPGEVDAKLAVVSERGRARISDYVFGEGGDTMESVVGRLLRERGLTVAVAESCTGGLIGHRITNVPGSSAYFLAGLVCYGNDTKRSALGVAADTLDVHGAVSEQTARAMAIGARAAARSDLGLATTGIAGPDGETAGKPVGTVWVALAWEGGVEARLYRLGGTRDWIKLLSSQIALDWLRRYALGLPFAEMGIAGGEEKAPRDAGAT